MKAILKIILWIPVVIGYFLAGGYWWLTVNDPVLRRRKFSATVSFFTRIVLWYTNTKLTVRNFPIDNKSYFIVSNHLGLFDILMLSSIKNCLFITSVEMRGTPLLGAMCEMGGSLFVERRSRAMMHQEIENIRQALKQGFNVVLYPEGTSTNGEQVLPFKKSLMTAAAGTEVPILPMVVNFTHVNGEEMSWKWRNHVCWYGDHSFASALFKMMSINELRAEIEFLEPIICRSEAERTLVAQNAHAQISEKFKKIPLGPNEVSTFKLPKSLQKHEPSRMGNV